MLNLILMKNQHEAASVFGRDVQIMFLTNAALTG
jgi:hypothetical protein